jgi:hypothetical protein
MGSGGSLTLWSPSNKAGAVWGLIIDTVQFVYFMWDPADIVRTSTQSLAALILMVGFFKHEQSY